VLFFWNFFVQKNGLYHPLEDVKSDNHPYVDVAKSDHKSNMKYESKFLLYFWLHAENEM